MPSIINTQPLFYDYLLHLPTLKMKECFGLGYFEQTIVRDKIQKVITMAYDRLIDQHDLRHFNVYGEIGEQFDDNFYRELKETVSNKLHDEDTWIFLDDLMPRKEIEDEQENADFMTKMGASIGVSLPRSQTTGRVKLKDTLILLINHDLDPLSGQELMHMAKIS